MRNGNVKQEIIRHFMMNPTARLRVRQIERETKAHLPSIVRYVKELEQEGLLKRNVISGVTFYQADRSSPQYGLAKRLHNIRALHESGLVSHLAKQSGDAPIIVFGSYERGEDVEGSDIDIFIESDKSGIKGIDQFERLTGRSIQLFINKSIKAIRNRELANNIINGTKLSGFIEVF
jgi:predicted nucleotidyltransferase